MCDALTGIDRVDEDVETYLGRVGEVESVNVITDRRSGRSKGFAFVEMTTEEEAQAAISQLDGATVDDRQIRVSEARPQRPRSDRGGGGRRGGRRSWDY